MTWKTCALAAVASVLFGCGSPRPADDPQRLQCGLERFVVTDVFGGWQKFVLEDRTTISASATPSVNLLALSAGGELGVFGAGFLRGWAEAGPDAKPMARTDVQIVTGVSAGALLASHAFIGDDTFLHERLPAIGRADLFSSRLLSLLWANSVLDDTGKNVNQAEVVLTSALIERVARSVGRFLYIGVVDLDSGRFLQIDMVRLAREVTPATRRDACYRAVIGASTAVPVVMSPKFVDDMMLTDGALRHQLFAPEPPQEPLPAGIVGNLVAVLHTNLGQAEADSCNGIGGKTCNGVLPIAARAAAIGTDQLLKDSVVAIEALAHRLGSGNPAGTGLETFYATATEASAACAGMRARHCTSGDDTSYCVETMRCLADEGRRQGLLAVGAAQPWKRFEQLDWGR